MQTTDRRRLAVLLDHVTAVRKFDAHHLAVQALLSADLVARLALLALRDTERARARARARARDMAQNPANETDCGFQSSIPAGSVLASLPGCASAGTDGAVPVYGARRTTGRTHRVELPRVGDLGDGRLQVDTACSAVHQPIWVHACDNPLTAPWVGASPCTEERAGDARLRIPVGEGRQAVGGLARVDVIVLRAPLLARLFDLCIATAMATVVIQGWKSRTGGNTIRALKRARYTRPSICCTMHYSQPSSPSRPLI
jgi:hypothetical protein